MILDGGSYVPPTVEAQCCSLVTWQFVQKSISHLWFLSFIQNLLKICHIRKTIRFLGEKRKKKTFCDLESSNICYLQHQKHDPYKKKKTAEVDFTQTKNFSYLKMQLRKEKESTEREETPAECVSDEGSMLENA